MKTPEQIVNGHNDTRKVNHEESSITGHQDEGHELVSDNGRKSKLLHLNSKIDLQRASNLLLNDDKEDGDCTTNDHLHKSMRAQDVSFSNNQFMVMDYTDSMSMPS